MPPSLVGKGVRGLIRKAPFGCPIYLKIGKNYLALREEEAQNVVLKS
ncbi:MAG: FeoA family protein [Bacteroidota bacterium]